MGGRNGRDGSRLTGAERDGLTPRSRALGARGGGTAPGAATTWPEQQRQASREGQSCGAPRGPSWPPDPGCPATRSTAACTTSSSASAKPGTRPLIRRRTRSQRTDAGL